MITIYRLPQGDSFVLQASALTDENGAIAADLSTWTFAFAIKRFLDDPDSSALVAISGAQVKTSGGRALIALAPAAISALLPGTAYAYAWKAITPGLVVKTVASGWFALERTALADFPASALPAGLRMTTEDGTVLTTEDGTPLIEG